MPTLEDALQHTEQAAKKLTKTAKQLALVARRAEKAAVSGELAKLHEARARLNDVNNEITAVVVEATRWPWNEPEEEELLKSRYIDEVAAAANKLQIPFHRHHESLGSSYPLLVRMDSKKKVVQLGRRRVKALRPSMLLRRIAKIRQARPRQTPEQFLETLYLGYRAVLGMKALKALGDDEAHQRPDSYVLLVEVHKALTLLPDARKDYPLDEFAQNLHQLVVSQLLATQCGRILHLEQAARANRGVLTVIDDHGRNFDYFSVAFLNRVQV